MANNKQEIRVDPPRGFDLGAFDKATAALASDVDSLTRCAASVKRALSNVQKDGAPTTLATTDAAKVIGKNCQQLIELCSSIAPRIQAVTMGLDQWHAAERGSRRARFEATAKELKWRIAGDWPEPVVNGFVFVVVNEEKGNATVNGAPVSGNVTAETLVRQIKDELEEIARDLSDPREFIASVWKAFQSLGVGEDEGVGVFNLLRQLLWLRQTKKFQKDPAASHFRPYPLAQFRADMTAYLAAGAPPHKQGGNTYALDIVGGSFADEGIFMYFPVTDRLATCGRLTLRKQ